MKKVLLLCALCSLTIASDVYAVFNIKAVQEANLAVDITGVVDKILVDVDSKVKRGDVLLSLANVDRLAQIKSIQEQYAFAKSQYERYNKSADVIDKNTLDNYRANYKKLEADYKYYQTLYEKSILRAPFDGVIAEKKIELGDGVGGSTTTLFRLVSHNKKMLLYFDSKYINIIKVGDIYEYAIDGAGAKSKATITKIYPTIDSNTRKATAEAIVGNELKSGLFGDGYIKTSKQDESSRDNKDDIYKSIINDINDEGIESIRF